MAVIDILEDRVLIYVKFDSVESISKLNAIDDSGEIVMNSGNVITITTGLNDFFSKFKAQVPASGSL